MAALAWSPLIFIRDTIIGGWTVGFRFLAFLLHGDDHGTGVSANVDDIAEITVGVVEVVAKLLMTLCCKAAPDASLLTVYFLQFVLFIIQVHGDCDSWW